MENKKRQRAANFTAAESLFMCSLVEKYKHIIENKKTDGATVAEKQKAWKLLTNEYNSNTTHVARTTENLISNYKNLKTKAKKQHSNQKLTITSTNINMDTSSIAETIAESVEAHGQNWRIISGEVHLPPEECQIRFNKIVKEAKKSESQYMKQINGTGGGPPLSPPNDPLLEKVKTLIGPSLDGMYTMYDSDADFMKEQQELLPVTRQINPIELSVAAEVKGEPSIPKVTKRLNILKKRLDPALEDGATAGTSRKKKNVVESFVKLSECKNELVELQMKIAQEQHANQIAIQKMELEKMQTQMEFEKIKQEMEITFLKEKYALELSILKNKRNYIPQ